MLTFKHGVGVAFFYTPIGPLLRGAGHVPGNPNLVFGHPIISRFGGAFFSSTLDPKAHPFPTSIPARWTPPRCSAEPKFGSRMREGAAISSLRNPQVADSQTFAVNADHAF